MGGVAQAKSDADFAAISARRNRWETIVRGRFLRAENGAISAAEIAFVRKVLQRRALWGMKKRGPIARSAFHPSP